MTWITMFCLLCVLSSPAWSKSEFAEDAPQKDRDSIATLSGNVFSTIRDSATRLNYDNGNLLIEGHLNKEQQAHGPMRYLDLDGSVICEMNYVQDLFLDKDQKPYEGDFECSDSQGRVRLKSQYKKGKADGPAQLIYSTGKPLMELMYRNGELEGKARFYDLKGRLTSEVTYSKDKPKGPMTSYYPNGTPAAKMQFQNDQYDGKMSVYYRSGVTQTEATYQDGMPKDMVMYTPDHVVIYRWKDTGNKKKPAEAQYFDEKGEFIKSPEEYNEALRGQTGNLTDLYYKRGLAYYYWQNDRNAVLDFTRVIQADPNRHFAYYYRAVANFRLEQYTSAIEDFTKIEKQLSSDYDIKGWLVRAYHYRGWNYYLQKKYEQSVSDGLWVIENDSDYGELHKIYNNIGIAYSAWDQKDKALEFYNKTIEHNHYYKAYYNRAILYREQGKDDQAIADYKKTLDIQPEYEHTYNNLANIYSDQKKYEEALQLYQRGLTFDPTDLLNNTGLALIYAKTKQMDLAQKQIELIAALRPDHHTVVGVRAFILKLKGDHQEAIEQYDRAINLKPLAEYYVNRGEIYDVLGDHSKSLENYRAAVQTDAEHVGGQYKLARALIVASEMKNSKPELEEAKSLLDKALVKAPRNADVMDTMALWHLINGNQQGRNEQEYEKAAEYFSQAIALAPTESLYYSNRVAAYLNLRQYDKAWDDVHQVERMGGELKQAMVHLLKSKSGRDQ